MLGLTARDWGRGVGGFDSGLFQPCPWGIDLPWPVTAQAVTLPLTGSSLPTTALLSYDTASVEPLSASCTSPLSVLVLCSGVTENKSTMLVSNKRS